MCQYIVHGVRVGIDGGGAEQDIMMEILDHDDRGQSKFLHM